MKTREREKRGRLRFISERSERFIETARFLLHVCGANASFLFISSRKSSFFCAKQVEKFTELYYNDLDKSEFEEVTMASRILHLAVAEKIIERITIKDKNRFRLGIILPDAYRDEVPKANSHLKIRICGGSKKTYDLHRFQSAFGAKITTDDLYMGYYLHLIQDMVYRRLVYEKYNWNPKIPGNVQRLWNDYKLINPYVITNYRLKNNLRLPENFADEDIYTLYPFDIDKLCDNLNRDYLEAENTSDESAFFFTKDMADEYISNAAEVCVTEIEAIREGKYIVEYYDYAWWDLCPSILKTTQNTRDLGGYPTVDGKITKLDSLIRSDVQRYPSEEDFEFLKSHNITTIVDMRSEKDIEKKPSGFATQDDFNYIHCPIPEGGDAPESEEAVPESYMSIACSLGMKYVFSTIASANGGIMFNCSAGKDRTGVVSAILLMHAGVRDEDIIDNYVLTREYGKERLALIHQNFPDINMNIITPRDDFMREFLHLFRERFHTTEFYFKEIGLNNAEIFDITKKCV